jgi:glycosyltransferase involved in cell wall biosynthesis
MRTELNIPQDAHVLGHVGSFHFEKNHDFLIHLFKKMATSDLKLHLLLVGDGPLKEKFEDHVKTLNLEKRVIFTGVRSDVPDLLKAMDVFVFPSLFEGLGLAIVEAQAAGLPCLVADTVPQEASIVEGAVTFLPLENSDDQWIKAIKQVLEEDKINEERALAQVASSPFNIEHNVTMLMELYETLSGKQDKKDAA